MISPATMHRPVVTIVSQATRDCGSSARMASRIESEIWSAILSGWPSVTDSEVKVQLVMFAPAPVCGSRRRQLMRVPRRRGRAELVATARLSVSPTSRSRPEAVRMSTSLVSCSNPTPGAETSLATMISAPFEPASRRVGRRRSPVSAANPTSVWPAASCAARGRRGCRGSARGRPRARRRPSSACGRRPPSGRKSATAAAMTITSAPAARRRPRRPSRPRSRPRTTVDAGGRPADWPWCTSVTWAPARRGLRRDGVALLARAAVADEADRVDRLAGAAGGDQHRDRPARSPRAEHAVDGGHDGGSGAARRPGADVAAGQAARLGLDDVHAPAPQRGEVVAAPPGAPTSRCAWPGRPAPAPGWRSG